MNIVNCPTCASGAECADYILVHDGAKILSFAKCNMAKPGAAVRTLRTVFKGTKAQCDAEIARLNLAKGIYGARAD